LRGEENQLLLQFVSQFAKEQLRPVREGSDRYPFVNFFTSPLVTALEMKLFHLGLSEKMGGVGDENIGVICQVLEALAVEDASFSMLLFTHLAGVALLKEAHAEKFLQQHFHSGQIPSDLLLAFPAMERLASYRPKLKAIAIDGKYYLVGQWDYLLLAPIAKHAIVWAQIEGQSWPSWFVVDLGQKEIERGGALVTLGMHALPTSDVNFKNAEGILLTSSDNGAIIGQKVADRLMLAVAAMGVGLMRGCYQEAHRYALERRQGGRELIYWPEVRMMLAKMKIKLDALALGYQQAIYTQENNLIGWKQNSLAVALLLKEMISEFTSDGIQILGGSGYMTDFGQEKRFRDARHLQAIFGSLGEKIYDYLGEE